MELEELLAALLADPAERTGEFRLSMALSQFIRTGPRADVVRLLDVVDQPLALSTHGAFLPPASGIVLSVVSRFPRPSLVPKLVQLSWSCADRERLQIVRALLEIGSRADSSNAVEAGLDVASRLVRDEVPVGITDPLYWLRRRPMYPDLVLPRLSEFGAFSGWRDEAEATRVAYLAAFPETTSATSFYTFDELRNWAEHDDEQLLSLATQHAPHTTRDGMADVQALPDVLRIPWLAWIVEAEVLNGGFAQYFGNQGRDSAVLAADAFDELGWTDFAQLQRDALAVFDHAELDSARSRPDGPDETDIAPNDFDVVEEAFMRSQNQRTVSDGLASWLRLRVIDVADAIGVAVDPADRPSV